MKYIGLCLSVFLLVSCGAVPTKPDDPGSVSPTVDDSVYIESTLYFNARTASVSMRAPISDAGRLSSGYYIQFRSKTNQAVKNIAIIAGGERIVLEQGVRYVSAKKGLNFALTLNDSLYISSEPTTTFLFEFDGESKIIRVENHKLSEFMAGGDE